MLRRALRLARNVVFDLRYGGFLGGIRPTRYSDHGAADTVNSDYSALAKIFKGFVRPGDVLVDVGCGRGRVLNYWLAKHPGHKVIGLELDEEIAAETRSRLRKHPEVEVIAGDALANLPPSASVLFLYNPFEEPIVRKFSERCKEVYAGRRDLRIVYYKPLFGHVFKDDPAWAVEERTFRTAFERDLRYCVLRQGRGGVMSSDDRRS